MSTNFPTAKDDSTSLPVEATTEQLSVNHQPSHQNLSDAVVAIEDKLGIDSSADTDSIDYKINNIDHETDISNVGTNTHDDIDTHIADTTNPHSVTKTQVGLGDVENLKVKLDATTAPTADDDSGDGYSIGSAWIDVTNDKAYICVDATATAAVWVRGVEDHTELTNIGSNTHAQIDTHIANTANPHSVDIDDVTPTTTKGDVIVENGSNAIRVAVGSNNQVLTADSTEASGVKWESPTTASSNAYIATAGESISAGDAVSMEQNTDSIDLEKSSSQYLSIVDGSQTGLDLSTTPFTLQCWYKPESVGLNYGLISKRQAIATTGGYTLYINASDKIQLEVGNIGVGADTVTGNTSLSAGTWYHITAVRDGTNMKVYLNAVDDSSSTVTDNARNVDNAHAFAIGALRTDTPDNYADGLVDDVRVYNVARTEAQVLADYQTQLDGDEANLQGYWTLNGALTDKTSNNNDLTNNNAAVFSQVVPFTMSSARVVKSNATSAFLAQSFIGFAESNIAVTATGSIVIGGLITGLTGLTIGETYYLSDTPGEISSSVGTITRKVGIANSTTSLVVTNIW